MPKAVISNRIFIELPDRDMREEIKKALTYVIPSLRRDHPPTTIRNMSPVKGDIFSIPSGRLDLVPEGYEVIDKRSIIPEEFPIFEGVLRDSQQDIWDVVEDSCIINAWVSFGKTFTALAIAGKLEQKTLVVTHNTGLRTQWVREIEKVYGFTPGIIGSGKFDISTPIVVGNVQTLYNRIPEVYNKFGLLILDECLDYNTYVTTREGRRTIGAIVNKKEFLDVLSFNKETGEFEWKPVLRHFKNEQKDLMIKFKFDTGSVLKCTMNHTVYSYNKGRVCAELLMEGDYVVSEKTHKTAHLLRKEAMPIALGLILGDGCLAETASSVRISITNGQAQREYLEYKKGLLEGAFLSDTVESLSGYKPENKVYNINSLSFKDIDNYRGELYGSNRSKTFISKKIADILTVESWSLIYQDDGSINNTGNAITFSFCELDTDSINNLLESLKKLFNIQRGEVTSFKCKKNFQYITLKVGALNKFLTKVSKYIHPCLEYKKGTYKEVPFVGITPVKAFEDFTVQKIVDIDFEKATGGYRYNIEVADNHNYFAGGKLVSNCHHCSATTFNRVIDKSSARYKIGLSGTIKRKDGKHVVFKDFFGDKLFQPPPENYMEPVIHIIKSGIKLIDGEVPWAKKMNKLAYNENYQHSVAMAASTYAAMGHKVLVVSDRVEFLQNCAQLSGSNAICVTGAISDQSEREAMLKSISVGEKDILYGTQSIFSEGISLNELSCLILATPINNESLLEQLIGRVIRECPNKLQPVIVDINLLGKTATNQARNRLGLYIQKGWRIETI